jgi:hypothetical protein
MSRLKMLINNEEVVCRKDFTITEEMLATSSTILNNCYPKSWENDKNYVSRFYYPKDYSKCKIYKDDVLVFCGVVKNSGNISLNPRYPHFCSLQILDFKTLLSEGETLDFVISNKTITEAIEMIIDAIKDYGFVLGNINIFGADDIIGAYSTQNKTAYDVFQYLADITGSKWFTRLIDEDKVAIDFYDPTLMTRGKNIEYNVAWFEENNINDISFNYGSRDYRNKQIMQSDEVYASIDYIDNLVSNGYDSTFLLTSNVGIVKSIKVNNVEVSFTTNVNKEIGIDADFCYTPGKNQIESAETYSAGTRIEIVYTPIVKGRQIVYNNDEVDRIANQTGRKGIISRYENRNDVLSSAELDKVGQSYIKYKGSAEVNLKVVTDDKDIYNIGQIVHFEAPIDDLTQDYMVKRKEIKVINTTDQEKIFYTYELSSSFNSERAINWFDNQRRKAKGNIGEGEAITRNVDIENSANIIFNNYSKIELNVTGDNTLNCGLNAPFVS